MFKIRRCDGVDERKGFDVNLCKDGAFLARY
jgi:hypothetical protein